MNALIASNYNTFLYDGPARAALAPSALAGIGALYGCAPGAHRSPDILDLGCGTGNQLVEVGQGTTGRLTGTDISQEACRVAEERCRPFGGRATIRCADFLDLRAEELGAFDLIYNIGVIYITPPAVQACLLRLIAACLRPGGLAVISYYAGTLPLVRAALHQSLLPAIDPGLAADARIALARSRLRAMQDAARASEDATSADPLVAAIEQTLGLSDLLFFHEVLNGGFHALQTSALATTLEEGGVRFLTYLGIGRTAGGASGRERAMAADLEDLRGWGGYRFALFGKPPHDGAPDLRSPRVAWRSSISRRDGAPGSAGTFADSGGRMSVTVPHPLTAACLDALNDHGPLSWDDVLARVPAPVDNANAALASLEADMKILWQAALLQPLAKQE